MVKEPIRGENILDLFMTTNPTLVNLVSIIPGLSDHDIVSCVVDTKPKVSKQPPRTAHLYRNTNWESFSEYMKSFCHFFILNFEDKTVEMVWQEFIEALEKGISRFVPTKHISGRKYLSWMTQSIKGEIRR